MFTPASFHSTYCCQLWKTVDRTRFSSFPSAIITLCRFKTVCSTSCCHLLNEFVSSLFSSRLTAEITFSRSITILSTVSNQACNAAFMCRFTIACTHDDIRICHSVKTSHLCKIDCIRSPVSFAIALASLPLVVDFCLMRSLQLLKEDVMRALTILSMHMRIVAFTRASRLAHCCHF